MNPAPHRVEDVARQPGRNGFLRGWSQRRGFTLLEICIVLVIIAVLMGVVAPGMQSALAEAGLRADARQLSLMVKTAMLQSVEEHRTYALNLSETDMSLGPIAPPDPDASEEPADPNQPLELAQDSTQNWKLDPKNKLLLPDPEGRGKWQPIESAQWVFRPGELCPAKQICFTRGQAMLQVTFNALTGNVEDERSIFP